MIDTMDFGLEIVLPRVAREQIKEFQS